MKRAYAIETAKKIGQKVVLSGWINARRDHGKLVFLDLRDRSGIVQVVAGAEASDRHDEDVIMVEGRVVERSSKNINPHLRTGEVEVKAEKIEVLAKSKTPPFEVAEDGLKIAEELRLRYRYLDLRRPRMVKNMEMRHKVIKAVRDFLDEKGFLEIETPILTKSTPEGARDFIVPSRLQSGKFYALPQSPQQYKQLLMVAGLEKYYQIARCFRDEDSRADRSYGEFTQLDLEASFVSQEEILSLIEELMINLAEKVSGRKVFKKPFPRIKYQEAMRKFGDDKFDLREKKDPNVLAFAWVIDFPLFEKTKGAPIAPSHHPFTAPKDDDLPLLDKDPMKARSWQHDLVCNSLELGGGSLRITNPEVQKKIFKILGYKEKEILQKFGHLLTAFAYGVPPHGGIALGVERLLMLLAGEENTREVTAFPMTSGGHSSVMDAPSEVSEEQLKELGISINREKKK